ncbi:MAG: surface carbohydrate biosynthesis protein [Sphingomicrobium sp.]
MTTIYLPVEISRREIVSRAFLATQLAADGHDVFVFGSDFFDRGEWPGPGIYIGKNVFRDNVPHDLTFYNRMKAAGIRVWHHDEEGGLYFGEGPEQWAGELASRVDARCLGSDDKVLTWGDYQARHFESTGTQAGVHVIGSVNFEIYQPKYASCFEEYDEAQTGGLSDYVLVNTRFGLVNGYNESGKHVLDAVPTHFDRRTTINVYLEEGVILYSMLQAVAELAFRSPQTVICIRPHPSEDPDFYARLVEKLPNVRMADSGDVGSWIRRSRCVFQNGCTTAIQADIAGKAVVTYLPPGATGAGTVAIPNEVGTIVTSPEEAIVALELPRANQSGRWPLAISRLDTIDRVSALVRDEGFAGPPASEAALRMAVRQHTRDALRRLAYFAFPETLEAAKRRERCFDLPLFGKFPDFTALAQRYWARSVRVRQYSKHCWRVSPE